MVLNIYNTNNANNIPAKYRGKIRQTIASFIKKNRLNQQSTVSVHFVSKSRIQSLNKKYRQIDKPTDVLSFPIWPKRYEIPKKGKINLGDIFVCPDFAQEDIGEIIEHSLNHLIGKHH